MLICPTTINSQIAKRPNYVSRRLWDKISLHSPVRVPPPPKICNLTSRDCKRSLMAAPGCWPDNGQTGLTFPPGGLAPFKQPPAADKRCVSTSVSVRLLLPRAGLEQSTLRFFIIGRALHICKSQTSTKVKSRLLHPLSTNAMWAGRGLIMCWLAKERSRLRWSEAPSVPSWGAPY